jgi:hypothetical protein
MMNFLEETIIVLMHQWFIKVKKTTFFDENAGKIVFWGTRITFILI